MDAKEPFLNPTITPSPLFLVHLTVPMHVPHPANYGQVKSKDATAPTQTQCKRQGWNSSAFLSFLAKVPVGVS